MELFLIICMLRKSAVKTTPEKYNTDAQWSTAMISMANALTVGLAAQGQKFGCSRGMTKYSSGADAWLALDSSANPPDVVIEEGAFAVLSGKRRYSIFREDQWKRQVDLLSAIKNSNVLFKASTDLAPGESGIDYYGKSFNFWDGLWYSLGSYLVGKNDIKNNSYFMYHWGTTSSVDHFYNEYDKIDLGKAISSYKISNVNGHNIYWREFEYGYVYVNPTLNNVTSIPLPEPCKQRTHNNLNSDLNYLPNINSISLKSHRAAILYKSNYQSSPSSSPPPPPVTDNSSILLEAEDGDLYSPMRSATDSNASSGEYIWVTSGNGGYAEYSFHIPEAGTYYIWGRVKGTTAGYNSFYFSVDNGNHVTWNLPVSSKWGWDQAASAYFSAGQHTIKIEQREYRAQLDQLIITKDQNYVSQAQGSGNQTTIEAEDGDLYSPMRSSTDSNASSGEYIWVTSGNGGYAEYSFHIPEAGTYYIWGRVKGTTTGYNSFYFSVDNGNHVTWNLPVSSKWGWDQAASAYFSAGQHTIKIEQREYRAQLDQLIITKDQNYVPNG